MITNQSNSFKPADAIAGAVEATIEPHQGDVGSKSEYCVRVRREVPQFADKVIEANSIEDAFEKVHEMLICDWSEEFLNWELCPVGCLAARFETVEIGEGSRIDGKSDATPFSSDDLDYAFEIDPERLDQHAFNYSLIGIWGQREIFWPLGDAYSKMGR